MRLLRLARLALAKLLAPFPMPVITPIDLAIVPTRPVVGGFAILAVIRAKGGPR